MKRLHRLIIMSFLGPFVMTFFIVLFLLLMQFLWRYIDELVGKGLDMKIIAEFLLYASSGLVPLALPLAILLSSLMAFGNMGEYYELTAIKASGISLRRILVPVLILVLFISTGAFFFSNNILPVTNLKMRTLRFDVQQLRPEIVITEGVFYKGIENYSIRVNRKDPVTNLLYDLKIYDHSNHRGNLDVTVADSGRMKITADRQNMIITLWSGSKYTEEDEGRRRKDRRFPHRLLKFQEQNILIKMTGFEFSRSSENVFKNSYQMLNVSQLKRTTDSLKNGLIRQSIEFKANLIRNSLFAVNNRSLAIRQSADKSHFVTQSPYRSPAEERIAEASARKTAARMAALQSRKDLDSELKVPSAPVPVLKDSIPVKPLKIITNFDSLLTSFSLNEQQDIIKTASNHVAANEFMVVNTAQQMEVETRWLRRHEIEWHRKFALSFACLIFLFIGAPLGAIIRKGGLGLPTVISTLLFILYYIISLTGQKFVEESVLTSFQGMWLSSFILVIAGVFLTYQASNDSAILNIDTYVNWLREKAGLRKGIMLEKKAHIAGRFDLIEIPREQLQGEFKTIGEMAAKCLESLKSDATWLSIARKSFENRSFFYLIEFGIHYNSFIDHVILSKWFRIPYFRQRLSEFPLINGRTTSTIFTKKALRWFALVVFPVGLIRMIHLKIKIHRLSRSLKHVMDLSSGMINLLNSSAIVIDADCE